MRLGLWHWESDVSVDMLSKRAVQWMTDHGINAETESSGVGMEIVSPPPPNVLSGAHGMNSAAELLQVLRHLGVQAGPSQGLHVHVNAVNPDSPGEPLDFTGIISVWTAWAKYQLAVDEMLSPGRADNEWAQRMFFANGQPWTRSAPDDCRSGASTCTALIFKNIHELMVNKEAGVETDQMTLCNKMFALPHDPEPCRQRYAHQRYFQLNLLPLTRYGTIEFRSHSATVNTERIARWVQFLTAFVEHFGSSPEGKASTAMYWQGSMEEDFATLRTAQRFATLEQLFSELGDKVDGDSLAFYSERRWEAADPLCEADLKDVNDAAKSLLETRETPETREAPVGHGRSSPEVAVPPRVFSPPQLRVPLQRRVPVVEFED